MKKLICALIAAFIACACTLCGCGIFGVRDGADGKDGQDLNIYDIYEATNAERERRGEEQLDFLSFLREYLNYDFKYSEEESLQAVMNRSVLSAVSIVSEFSYRNTTAQHAGSGVIVELDKDAGNAYILTNAHVIYDSSASPQAASSIYIFLYGNDDILNEDVVFNCSIKASLVNYSISYDLALLKIKDSDILKKSDARAAVFAESDDIYVGESVYTVGNPQGYGISVTSGIISKESEFITLDFASGKNISNYYRVMRTDVGINAGNSGGALFDTSGRIVGIINAKDADPENENMGFALCGSYVKRLWKLMRDSVSSSGSNYGVRHAVFPTDYSYTSKASYNNETNLTEITDTVVVGTTNGVLTSGDILVHIKITDKSGTVVEDRDITRFYHLDDALISARSGYSIIYTVKRGGETVVLSATNPNLQNFS